MVALFDAKPPAWKGANGPEELVWAMYRAASAIGGSQPDFFPHYSEKYTAWQPEGAFAGSNLKEAEKHRYLSRLEGRMRGRSPELRGRFGPGAAAPRVMWRSSCEDVLEHLEKSEQRAPLISLQRYRDQANAPWRYQSVFAAPIH